MAGKPTPNKYRSELGLRLQQARKKLFKTSKECAEKYDVSPSMWTDMEKGRVVFSPEKIIHLAEFLHVDAGWLLTGKKAETQKTPPNYGEVWNLDTQTSQLVGLATTISLTLQTLIIGASQGFTSGNDVLNLMERIVDTIDKDQASLNLERPEIKQA